MLMETCDDKVKLITQESNSHSGGEIKSTDLIKKINFAIMEMSIQLGIKTVPVSGSK